MRGALTITHTHTRAHTHVYTHAHTHTHTHTHTRELRYSTHFSLFLSFHFSISFFHFIFFHNPFYFLLGRILTFTESESRTRFFAVSDPSVLTQTLKEVRKLTHREAETSSRYRLSRHFVNIKCKYIICI